MRKRNPRQANGARRKKIREWVLRTYDTCAICGQPVDKTLKTPHPMSPEVDEIIPVSLGGSPYLKENVQLAHKVCNQRKGNRLDYKYQPQKLPESPIKTSRQW